MEQHGVKFTKEEGKLRKSLDLCRIAYLHAPFFNPAMKAVAPIRRNLGVRTFFNLLGPLANPSRPAYQLLGVYNLPLFRLYSYTYQASGTRFGVVHSVDGYDEISLTSEFKVAMPDKEKVYTPEMIGLKRCRHEDLWGGDTPEAASKIFDAVLNNTATEAQRNCVLANSGFAIQVICPQKSIEECIAEALESLESGSALGALKKFIEVNS
jgi:anthranilate phosphoribosyltransferase